LKQNPRAAAPAPTQLAFVYRDTAEKERQNGLAACPITTGVRLPEYSGKGTPEGRRLLGFVAR
jgi:hypothetical protein